MSKKAEIYKEIAKKFEELAAVEGTGAKAEAKSEASLEDMDFKALKALAKSLGVSTRGTREQLIEAIQDAQNSDSDGDDGETSKKSGNSKSAKKSSKKKEEPEDDEDDDDSEGDDIRAKVEAAAEEMSDKELKEFCKDAGISTKGGRDAMLSKIEEAVRNGDLDESIFDDEDEEDDSDSEENEDEDDDDSEESEDDEDDEDDDSEDDEDSDEEDDGIADRDEVAKFAKSAKAQFKKGKLKIDAIKAFLKKAGVTVSKKQKPDELLDLYISTKAYFIDDEGDEHDFSDAYMLNEEPYCCGKPLDVKKQKGKHVGICSVCGGKYPLDEE